MRDRAPGFTLLEVIVALVVLGLVIGGIAQGFRFGLQVWDRQAGSIEYAAGLDATSRALRQLVGGMAPGGDADGPGIQGSQHRLVFSGAMPAWVPTSPVRSADMAIEVADGRLVLRWALRVHARLAAPLPAHDAVLLPNVSSVEFGYYAGGRWRDDWTETDPPDLVRIQIQSAGARWPDLVIAPPRRSAAE